MNVVIESLEKITACWQPRASCLSHFTDQARSHSLSLPHHDRQAEVGLLHKVGKAEVVLTAEQLARVGAVGVEQADGMLLDDDGGDEEALVVDGGPQCRADQRTPLGVIE